MMHRPIPKRFTLIVIDVDNLKSLNDSRGHLAGDKAIRIVGQSIRESIRKQDIAIRYGGDEFFILLANTKKAIVEKVINRIKENIRKRGKEENIHIEISAGAACSDCTCEIGKIIAIADNKMYKEKAGKKVKSKQIADELLELKQKIEAVRDELRNKVIWKPNGSVDKELMEVKIKLENLIKKHLKDAQ
jgi:diguanylate cyclase (GGDEF)-like protein